MPLTSKYSFKWAGGGFFSNVNDPVKFDNAVLYCFPKRETSIDDVYLCSVEMDE